MDMLASGSKGAIVIQRTGKFLNTTTDDRSGAADVLPARAENVAVVRHALAGLGEHLGMDEASVADLKTVVTEAAMNVVVHAYPEGAEGVLAVEAFAEGDGLTVEVRDQGMGIRPRPDVDRPSLRIGLTLIAALSSQLRDQRRQRPRHRDPDAPPAPRSRCGAGFRAEPGRVAARRDRGADRPARAGGRRARRVLGALAARQEISVDRLSDAMLLSDAIAAGAPGGFADGHVSLNLVDRDGGVVLRVGPMTEGGAERLRDSLDLPDVGSLAALADELRVESDDEGEHLVVEIAAPRGLGSVGLDQACSATSARIRSRVAAQDPRDVHLRVADPLGDLRLGQVVDEAQLQDQSARGRRGAAGPPPAPACPRSARSPSPRRRSTPTPAIRPPRRRPAGRARAGGGCGWPRAPRARRSGRARAWSAISPTDGERCSSTVSAAIALSTSAMRSCSPRGTRTVQTRSRKWRFSSPRIVGEAKAVKGVPRAGSKRSIALTRPRLATWSRSSKDSLAPR